ncbi:hypothetical protein MUO32_17705 [Shinella sp. CPCC 101442]|uniref:hypothetical protein n=1 Tax=Shinella sp. CPCC 101442 TaxID=2932265 RepID=UPI002152438D|nr:hypothetical protein [Shinella sp. CPCC 101442]MCR6500876.1 hypothetical protein [Shinella sp. CPCC 101442]
MTATKEEFFNPVKLSARDKAAATDETARTIIASEATAREKKTARLRELRLQQEPAEEPARPAAKTKRTPAAKKA